MRRGLGAGWRSRGWARERRLTDGGTYCTPNFPSTSLPGSEAYLMGSLLSCWVLLETCTLVLRWWQEAAGAGRAQWERAWWRGDEGNCLTGHPPPAVSIEISKVDRPPITDGEPGMAEQKTGLSVNEYAAKKAGRFGTVPTGLGDRTIGSRPIGTFGILCFVDLLLCQFTTICVSW